MMKKFVICLGNFTRLDDGIYLAGLQAFCECLENLHSSIPITLLVLSLCWKSWLLKLALLLLANVYGWPRRSLHKKLHYLQQIHISITRNFCSDLIRRICSRLEVNLNMILCFFRHWASSTKIWKAATKIGSIILRNLFWKASKFGLPVKC
ncbi:hypothetical protein POM88_035207 [Heracleum sosnowskyi]|uniref:Uncharacterized protein n=1 Tax=Heracleum sosnowskyi TaxID=360622 RepID=A0AAD8HN08_9APIA|nr:hypothetical protein POM88_035207 [Heracleum sosnowskyi]